MEKIGEMIDQMYTLRQQRLEIQKEAQRIGALENELKDKIIEVMQLEGIELVRGKTATASIKVDAYPSIEDFPKLVQWVVLNNRYDFLRKQINSAPFREMLEQQNITPPGTGSYLDTRLNLRKR